MLELDGVDSAVELPPNIFNNLEEATVEGWIKWDAQTPWSRFFDFGKQGQEVLVAQLDRGPGIGFEILTDEKLSGAELRMSGLPGLHEWCHLAAVSGRGGMKLYFDGVLIASNNYTGSFAAAANGEHNLLGRSNWKQDQPSNLDCKGQMAEIRVWSTARTEEQIRQNIFQQLTGQEQSLVGLWNFSEGDARDASPNHHHGKLLGSAKVLDATPPRIAPGAVRPSILLGRVTDETGGTLAGATIALEQDGEVIGSAEADKQGNYYGAVVANDRGYQLSATGANKCDWRLGLRLQPGEARRIDFVLRNTQVAGTVMALDYSPLASVVVEAVWYGTNASYEAGPRPTQASRTKDAPSGEEHGLTGEYFTFGVPLTGFPSIANTAPTLKRVDKTVAFPDKAAFGDTKLQNNFYARWTGRIRIATPGKYTFYTKADDGARLFINNRKVVDNEIKWDVEASGEIQLSAGDHDLVLDYLQMTGGANCYLFWAAGGIPKSVVPEQVLFPMSSPRPEVALVPLAPLRASALGTNTARTDKAGGFQFTNLKPGWYQVRAQGLDHDAYYRNDAGQVFDVEPGDSLVSLNLMVTPPRKGTWRQYTYAQGLAGDLVLCSYVARDGQVWFGTANGISRYDGRAFFNLTKEDGLSHDFVRSIYQDSDGTMWFGTDLGVSCYQTNVFVRHPLQEKLGREPVTAIASDASSNLWFGTLLHGVFRAHGNELTQFTTSNGLPNNQGLAFFQSRVGDFWVGTRRGLAKFDGTNFVSVPGMNALAFKPIPALSAGVDGSWWVATWGAGLFRVQDEMARPLGASDGFFGAVVWSLHCDPDGTLWLGGENHLSRFDGRRLVHFVSDEPLPDNVFVNCISRDAQGCLWVGTAAHGLWKHEETAFWNFSSADGLAGTAVNACLAAPDGTVWFGCEAGASRYQAGRFVNLTRAEGLRGDWVYSLARTADGLIWLGTGLPGTAIGEGRICLYNGANFITPPGEGWPVGGGVRTIAVAPDGGVWFENSGRAILHYDGQAVERFSVTDFGLTNDVTCLHCDVRGAVWMGSAGAGLVRYQAKQTTHFTGRQGLIDQSVNCLSSDPDGVLWIGTDGGVSRFDGSNFVNFTQSKGHLAGNEVHCIYRDSSGAHWFGTQRGVTRFDGAMWWSFDRRDGLAGNEIHGICEDGGGDFWFATEKGVTRYRPRRNPLAAPELRAQGDQEYADLSAPLPLTTGRRVAFQFNPVDTRTDPKNRWFRHKFIPGVVSIKEAIAGPDWDPPTQQSGVEWIPQRSGSYTFAVQYVDRDRNVSEPALAVLRVTPPWYLNGLIVFPAGGGVAGLLLWGVIARTLYARKRREAEQLREQMFRQEHESRVTLEAKNAELEAEMRRRQQAEQSLSLVEQEQTERFHTSGTLRPDAPSYLERRGDRELFAGLARGDFCYVLTSRQMGKSSLMVRTTRKLRKQGCTVATLDLTAIGQNLTPEQWYLGLLSRMGWQLDLEEELDQFWNEHGQLGASQRFFAAVQEVVLPKCSVSSNQNSAVSEQSSASREAAKADLLNTEHRLPDPGRLVIFVDELDLVRSLPFSTVEFFAAIRELYNRRAEEPALNKLAFCLLGVATPSELIQDPRVTPFNIGQRIELEDFTREELAPLARGLGRTTAADAELMDRIYGWTYGHPYLTQKLCASVVANPDVQSPAALDDLCRRLFLTPKAMDTDDNLAFARERLLRGQGPLREVLGLYEKILKGEPVESDSANALQGALRLAGLVREEGGALRVRNRIYETVFNGEWLSKLRT